MKKNKWNWVVITRLATLLIVGILNTVLIKPENIGTWRNYIGYGCLVLAAIYVVILIIKQIKSKKEGEVLEETNAIDK